MTNLDSVRRYQLICNGAYETVESQLKDRLAEHINAEVCSVTFALPNLFLPDLCTLEYPSALTLDLSGNDTRRPRPGTLVEIHVPLGSNEEKPEFVQPGSSSGNIF